MVATCRWFKVHWSQEIACSEREVPAERVHGGGLLCCWRIWSAVDVALMRLVSWAQRAEHHVKHTLAFPKSELEGLLPVGLVLDAPLVTSNWMMVGKVERPTIIIQSKTGHHRISKPIKIDITGGDFDALRVVMMLVLNSHQELAEYDFRGAPHMRGTTASRAQGLFGGVRFAMMVHATVSIRQEGRS